MLLLTNFGWLDELKKYNAKTTFFVLGKCSVAKQPPTNTLKKEYGEQPHPQPSKQLENQRQKYIANILKLHNLLILICFRPPYGRITRFQAKAISRYASIQSQWL